LVVALVCSAEVTTAQTQQQDTIAPVLAAPSTKEGWPLQKAALQRFGEQFHSAAQMYDALSKQMGPPARLSAAAIPDWSGVYARGVSTLRYDPDQSEAPEGSEIQAMPTAKLTPAARKKYIRQMHDTASGKEYDAQLSACLPPGMPRWYTEPYLRDFAISPDQTWMINELANEVRRIYTDGRDHPGPNDRFPTFDGDSIGFWAGDKLIIYTTSLMAGNFQRREPEHTADAEVVEVWRKIDADTLIADVWVFDPDVLLAPWFTRQTYAKEANADKQLRINYYDCVGTKNTRVIKTKDGSSTFEDLNFDNPSEKKKHK
jgi:hypothetical protein